MKNEECLICKQPLEYLEQAEKMECALCHKVEESNCRCVEGHYVCSDCHMSGMDTFLGVCLSDSSKNPYEILCKLMALPFCHMHGPEHHVLVGASLLTAYHNAGGVLDLQKALLEMQNRGRKVPGGICGLWGSCGAAVSTGIFVSIVTGSSPLSTESWGLCNRMTSRVLAKEADIGGPRCCKRNSSLAVLEAIDFAAEYLGVQMEKPEQIRCEYSHKNNQCIKERCPFHK
ncbi:MAG: SAM-dependent methyltransferase [Oscillospiraceae bacterium]|nr:SAM-dependent methyltransferase [Oscillospiraceae bacterium]